MSKLISPMKLHPSCAMQISMAIATGILITFIVLHFALPYLESYLPLR